jgi:copper chaperone CopZ
MRTTTFEVGEIHCANCENTIRAALSRRAGVALVVASAERNDVRVSFDDSEVSEAELRALLDETGFPPAG